MFSFSFCYSTCQNIFNYVQCSGCENIYLANRPNLEYLDTIYPQDYPTYDYKKSLGKLINKFRNKFQEKKLKPLIVYLKIMIKLLMLVLEEEIFKNI